jgi:hypothetical protein
MFSISEPSLASSSGRVLMSIAWLGISSAACFSSARAARASASMQALSTARVSSSRAGGSAGGRLCGSSGRHGESGAVMMKKRHFGDTSAAHVAAGDTSAEHVDVLSFHRHDAGHMFAATTRDGRHVVETALLRKH